MGNEHGKHAGEDEGFGMRVKAIIGSKPKNKIPDMFRRVPESGDIQVIADALSNLILFSKLGAPTLKKIASEMYERQCKAGDIMIQQGGTGLSASQLYVVKSGKFEVLERRKGVMFKVNSKEAGECFGEIALMYNCPRNATVAATTDASVWILDRDVFRMCVRHAVEECTSEVELFINSVPLLAKLPKEQKIKLVDALVEKTYGANEDVVKEGEMGNTFFVIKEGEAMVMANNAKINHLFKADYFGEQALLKEEPRKATVRTVTSCVVLCVDRPTFVSILGPLESAMVTEKCSDAMRQRMSKLKIGDPGQRPEADVVLKKVTLGAGSKRPNVSTVTAIGHLDEVQDLKRGGSKLAAHGGEDDNKLVVIEAEVLGEGAFSRVVRVTEETTGRQFAMKRMTKASAMQSPEHVFYEQHITCNIAHPFCLRQYASFQDPLHLYFLFDLMPGGDLMDVLVAEAKVVKYAVGSEKSMKPDIFAKKMKMWQGMEESLARFYVASIILALEYLQNHNLVFRDLKPENVLIDGQGYAKLGDFGFAKVVEPGSKTYTFCGTPGYVAPENIMGRGYNNSVDWWTLGVLMYVLLTARQPFTSPKAQDPMEVMRRIVDERWPIKYPSYMSDAARDLISRLLERKPVKRIGMLKGQAADVKNHPWFKGFDWGALSSRRMEPPRKPKDQDSEKRKRELHAACSRIPSVSATPEEMKEFDEVFKDF